MLLRAFLCGIASGMLMAAVYVAVFKLLGNEPDLLAAICAGCGVALFTFALFLLIARPTKRRIAAELDRRLGLNEKVRTMVEFADAEGDMIEVQREDTVCILEAAPKKAFRSRRAALNAIFPAIAAVLLVVSFLLPVIAAPDNPPDDTIDESDLWALTEWHITAVRELIEQIKSSEMYESAKPRLTGELEKLLSDLAPVTSKTAMKQRVITSMVAIDAVADEINTYTKLATALGASSSKTVAEFASAMGVPSDPINETEFAAIVASFKEETLKNELSSFAYALEAAADSAGTENDDLLYTAICESAALLRDYSSKVGTDGAESLSSVFEEVARRISLALDGQGINRSVSNSTIDGLMIIFGVAYGELPEELRVRNDGEVGTEGNEYEEKDNDDILNPGGLGGGEVIYGSNDLIYYPKDDVYIRYGDVIDEYNGKKTSMIEDSPMPDAVKDFIDKYFANLYNKKESND
ncbi:MAG: hypothetical protein ACI3XI_00090 [Eubacteriales bacterium]